MTLLDDDIDDLVRAFRADEARVDDATRARIWARVCDVEPDAPAALDALDPDTGVRRLRRRVARARPPVRLVGVAAAVLTLLAVGAVALRSGPADDAVTAGLPTTTAMPGGLDELADRVTIQSVPVLGSSPDTAYTYRAVRYATSSDGGVDRTTRVERNWVAVDGSGRYAVRADADPAAPRDETMTEAGSYDVGILTAPTAVTELDGADAIAAAIEQRPDHVFGPDSAHGIVDTLTYAGIPGPTRAGLLRALDRIGFVPVPAAEIGPNLLRVEGPGPSGSTVQADVDLLTGHVVAWMLRDPRGLHDRRTILVAELRGDIRGP